MRRTKALLVSIQALSPELDCKTGAAVVFPDIVPLQTNQLEARKTKISKWAVGPQKRVGGQTAAAATQMHALKE